MTQTTDPQAKKQPTRAQRRIRDMKRLRLARGVSQIGFAVLIVVAAVRHQTEEPATASVDALCPFGAVETLLTWASFGTFVNKIHLSNFVLGMAVLAATILVGNAFCGWVCPFGALQDALTWLRQKLHLPALTVPRAWDQLLRWGRFVVLGVVLYFTFTTSKLWFADYDPYVTLFGLHWVFEFDAGALAVPLAILGVTVVGSLLVDRFWCRYLCPFGAVFAVVGRFSVLRLRRSKAACTDCTLCDRPCPVGLEPSQAKPFVSTDCIGCMDCVAACPVKGALTVHGPVAVGFPIRPEAVPERKQREHALAGAKAER